MMKQSPKSPLPFLCLFTLVFAFASPLWAQEVEEAPRRAIPQGQLNVQRELTLPGNSVPFSTRVSTPDLEALPTRMVVEKGQITPKTLLLQEGFEGSFPSAAWTAFSQGGVDATWGKSSFRKTQGSFSGWCAKSGSAAPAAGQPVPNNMDAWMVSGPYNLSNIGSGNLSFDLWLQTEETFDFFYVAASLNGVNYTALGLGTNTNGFQRFSIDLKNWGPLGDLTRKPQVYFAFIYQTDSSVTHEGAYLDQIALDVSTGNGLNLLINQIDAASCPTLRAYVSVTDGAGNPITGLQSSNFTLAESGGTQTLNSQPATGSGERLAATLVLDGSGSLSNSDVANMKVASKAFIDLLNPGDSIAVYHFGSDVALVQDYTTNLAVGKLAVDALTNNLGNTSLYDAIVDAANHSLAVGGRRALVVMTDGMNNNSLASEQDAIQAAIAAGVPVFTIGFGNVDEDVLQRIASQTGGLFFLGASSADLQMILARIGTALGSQYLLTWSTSSVNGGSHPVTIDVNYQGQTATRSATYSQAGTACASSGVCTPGPTNLCLNRGRFRVEVRWTDFGQQTGPARVAPCGSDDSGILYFFTPDNWEMLIKVLDACALNQRYWVFAAATTNVGYTVTVTDTRNGAVKTYTNPLGNAAAAITDTSAFATCP